MIVPLIVLQSTSALALTGRDVYDKVHEVGIRMLNRTTQVTMILIDRGGSRRTRVFVEYGRRTGAGSYKTLLLFKTPPDLKDVGFLVHARTFADRDLWAYFPEFKRIRRIPSTNQDDSFFGSDFSYDDFGGPPDLDDYTYDMLKEETVDGMPAYVVKVTARVRRKFTHFIAWVSQEHWVQLRIDYYRDKELYRTGRFRDIRIIDGIPAPFHLVMENRTTDHRTEIMINEIRFSVDHPDSLFTHRALERGGR